MVADITPELLREKLGCPIDYVPLLDSINQQRKNINSALYKFMTLPYVNAIQVKDKNGTQVSLYDQVLGLRKKYNILETQTVAIVGRVGAYSNVTTAMLPLLGTQGEGSLSLSSFLTVSQGLVLTYGKEAKALEASVEDLRREFEEVLAILKRNLADVVEQLRVNEAALKKAETEYEKEKASAIIHGIVAIAYIAGAAIAIAIGDYPTAAELAVKSIPEIIDSIKAAIEAVGLAKVVQNLRNAVETSKKTKENLEILIPSFETSVTLTSKLGSAWDMIALSLAEIKDNQKRWSDPELYTKTMLQPTVQSWAAASVAVERFIREESGLPAIANAVKPIVPNMRAQMAVSFTTINISAHDNLGAKIASMNVTSAAITAVRLESVASNIALEIFAAPPLRDQMVRPHDLDSMIRSYGDTSQQLSSIGQTDVAAECNSIGEYVKQTVYPAMRDASVMLKQFASKQPDIPEMPIRDQSVWDRWYSSRISTLEHGREVSKTAYNSVHDVQFKTNNLSVHMTSRIAEFRTNSIQIRQDIRRKEQEQREKEEELRWNPFAGLIYAIRILAGEIADLQRRDEEAWQRIGYLDQLIQVCEAAQTSIGRLATQAETAERFWGELYTKLLVSADSWPVFKDLNLLPQQIALYNETWEAVRIAVRDW